MTIIIDFLKKISNNKKIMFAVIAGLVAIITVIALSTAFGDKKISPEIKEAIEEDYEKLLSGEGGTIYDLKPAIKVWDNERPEEVQYLTVIGRVKGGNLGFKFVDYSVHIYQNQNTFQVSFGDGYESKKELKESINIQYNANKSSFNKVKKY